MKKIYLCIMAICLSLSILPIQSKAAFVLPPTTITVVKTDEPIETKSLQLMRQTLA